jgi:hypothetical protein
MLRAIYFVLLIVFFGSVAAPTVYIALTSFEVYTFGRALIVGAVLGVAFAALSVRVLRQ